MAQRVLGAELPDGCSLYLRGSVVEREDLHPRSDIDLVAVGAVSLAIQTQLQGLLADALRPIDAAVLSHADLAENACHRVLLSARARHVGSPALRLALEPATDDTVWSFWWRYRVFLVTPRVGTTTGLRVCELKQLTRAFGVVRWFAEHRLTRDIATCLSWAETHVPEAAAVLRAAWGEVDECPDGLVGALDIRKVHAELVDFVRRTCAPGR